MEWFSNQRTAIKLSISFGVILFLLCTLVWFSYSTIKFLDNANKQLYNKDIVELKEKINELLHSEDEIRILMLSALLSADKNADKKDQQKILEEVKIKVEHNDNLIKEINNYKIEDPNTASIVEKLNKSYEIHRNARSTISIPTISEGKIEEAKKFVMEVQKTRFETLIKLASKLENVIRDKSNKILKNSEKEVSDAQMIFFIISAITFLMMIFLIIILNRQISAPLNAISKVARQISLGNLENVKFPISHRKDEVGVLLQAFSQLSQWIQNFTIEISASINSLTSSTTEISAAISQLASSAAQTATSVNETTSTIEEVRQTSHVANQKAQQVNKTAEKTVKISETGKQAAKLKVR